MVKSLLFIYLMSAISSGNAELITYPLDVIKTRMQIQGQQHFRYGGRKLPHLHLTAWASYIAKHEGFLGLWAGFSPTIIRQMFYSVAPLAIYRFLHKHLYIFNLENYYIPTIVAAGSLAGSIPALLTHPLELAKIKMQVAGMWRKHYTMHDTLKYEYNRHGLLGLWRGSRVNKQSSALVQIGNMSHYLVVKRFLVGEVQLGDDMLTHTLTSICAGFLAAVLSTPPDVIKARLMTQPLNLCGRGIYYSGPLDCFMKSIRSEGIMVLYTGFLANWIRLSPWTFIFWLSLQTLHDNLDRAGY